MGYYDDVLWQLPEFRRQIRHRIGQLSLLLTGCLFTESWDSPLLRKLTDDYRLMRHALQSLDSFSLSIEEKDYVMHRIWPALPMPLAPIEDTPQEPDYGDTTPPATPWLYWTSALSSAEFPTNLQAYTKQPLLPTQELSFLLPAGRHQLYLLLPEGSNWRIRDKRLECADVSAAFRRDARLVSIEGERFLVLTQSRPILGPVAFPLTLEILPPTTIEIEF